MPAAAAPALVRADEGVVDYPGYGEAVPACDHQPAPGPEPTQPGRGRAEQYLPRPQAAKGRPGRDRHEAGVAGWVEGDRIERDGHASRWPVNRAAFGVERGGEADQVAGHDRRRA